MQKLTNAQIKLLKTRKSNGWEFEKDCGACEYEMRREFAGSETSFENLKHAYKESIRAGTITGNEIDMRLLEIELAL